MKRRSRKAIQNLNLYARTVFVAGKVEVVQFVVGEIRDKNI